MPNSHLDDVMKKYRVSRLETIAPREPDKEAASIATQVNKKLENEIRDSSNNLANVFGNLSAVAGLAGSALSEFGKKAAEVEQEEMRRRKLASDGGSIPMTVKAKDIADLALLPIEGKSFTAQYWQYPDGKVSGVQITLRYSIKGKQYKHNIQVSDPENLKDASEISYLTGSKTRPTTQEAGRIRNLRYVAEASTSFMATPFPDRVKVNEIVSLMEDSLNYIKANNLFDNDVVKFIVKAAECVERIKTYNAQKGRVIEIQRLNKLGKDISDYFLSNFKGDIISQVGDMLSYGASSWGVDMGIDVDTTKFDTALAGTGRTLTAHVIDEKTKSLPPEIYSKKKELPTKEELAEEKFKRMLGKNR